jgi:hypothetical protein
MNMHAHMFDAYGIFLPRKSPEAMLQAMDESNCVMSLFASHEALLNPSIGESKDIEVVRKYPGRFRAYHVVMSRYLDPKADLRRMEKHSNVFVGFKFHSTCYQVALADPRHDPYWQYAEDRGLLVLAHTWGHNDLCGPAEVEKILKKYPTVVFIAGHSFHDEWDAAPRLAKDYPNFYIELTAVLDNRGALDLFIEKAGSKQILFGTDLPWFSIHHGVGAVLSAEMSDEDRRNILYRNAARLLRRFHWFPPLWNARAPGVS